MVFVLSLLACGLFADSPSTPPAPAVDPTAAASPSAPAAAPSTSPDPAAVTETHAAPPVPVASAQSPGHCAEGQSIWFECAVGQGRTVSLCGDAGPTWLQYHFGPPGAAALTVPSAPAGLGPFAFATGTWVRSQAEAVRFDNEGVTYLLVDKSGSGIDGELNNFQGVVVRQQDQELARFPCVGSLEATGLTGLQAALPALGYMD